MSRYIDADLLLEKLKSTPRYFTVKFDIENAQTADVKPINYGEWIRGNKIHCLNCNKSYADYVTNIEDEAELLLRSNYCPFCGAKMKKESEETE